MEIQSLMQMVKLPFSEFHTPAIVVRCPVDTTRSVYRIVLVMIPNLIDEQTSCTNIRFTEI